MSTTDPAALRTEFWSMPDEALADRATIAAVLYGSTSAMEVMAIKGGGPAYTRIGRRALYRKGEVLAWMKRTGRTVENTAQLAEAA